MRTRLLTLGTLVLVLAAGCEAAKPPRQGRIAGRVTLDGKPVPRGNVRFIALGAGGVNVLAPIADGAFEVPEGQGPTKGKYRVEFSVPSVRTQQVMHPDRPGEWLEDRVETLPARYHRDSAFTLDYDPDDDAPYTAVLTSQ
jgi:hypothetical protein